MSTYLAYQSSQVRIAELQRQAAEERLARRRQTKTQRSAKARPALRMTERLAGWLAAHRQATSS